MEQLLVEKYYTIDVQTCPNKHDPTRQELDIIPTLVFPDSEEHCCHLVWRTNPESHSTWIFICLTVGDNDLKILMEAPDLIAEIAQITTNTQPQEIECLLQVFGFHRK